MRGNLRTGGVQKSRQLDLAQVNQTYQERNSFRSTARTFGVSQVTVQKWLQKGRSSAPLKETIIESGKAAIVGAKANSVLEADE